MTLKRSVVRALVLALLDGDDGVSLIECLKELGTLGIDYITEPGERDNVIGILKQNIQNLTEDLIGKGHSSDKEKEEREMPCRKYFTALTLEMVGFPEKWREDYLKEICKGPLNIKIKEGKGKGYVDINFSAISLIIARLFSAAFGAFNPPQSGSNNETQEMGLIGELRNATLKAIKDLRNELFENFQNFHREKLSMKLSIEKEKLSIDALSYLNMLSSLMGGVLLVDKMIRNVQDESEATEWIELYDKHTGSFTFKENFIKPLSKDGVYKFPLDNMAVYHFFLISAALLRELSFLILHSGGNKEHTEEFLNFLDKITHSKKNEEERENIFNKMIKESQKNFESYLRDPENTPWMIDKIERDPMILKLNLIPLKILNFLAKNSIISRDKYSSVINFLSSPLIEELLKNRKIYELATLAAIAYDGLPVLTSHCWAIKLLGPIKKNQEEFRDILNNLAKGSKWIQGSGNAYFTEEIDGLFLLGKDILEDIDHLSFLSEKNLWDKGCDSVVVLLEVTMKRSHREDELRELLQELKDKVEFVEEALRMISGHYHAAGVLTVRKEIYDKLKEIPLDDDAPILAESIENMFSQDGRVKLYSSVINKITERIDRSGKLESPIAPLEFHEGELHE